MNLKYMSKNGYMRKLITYLFNKIGFEKAEIRMLRSVEKHR